VKYSAPCAAVPMKPGEMISDLRHILEDWDYEPGRISVRKIVGRDGHEKIQTRVDLGVLQIELAGRPDGQRPHDCESLLDYHERRLLEHTERCGDDGDFVLTPEECRELRHEGYLYYQRYLSLFVLEEYDGVVFDTTRTLRLIEFCARYAATPRDRHALDNQRPYVLMMHARSRALQALAEADPDKALRLVDGGLVQVRQALATLDPELEPETRSEIRLLAELRDEVLAELPEDTPTRLALALQDAVAAEDYERAARLRDQLAAAGPGAAPPADDPTSAGD
jgi:hypothetical protein